MRWPFSGTSTPTPSAGTHANGSAELSRRAAHSDMVAASADGSVGATPPRKRSFGFIGGGRFSLLSRKRNKSAGGGHRGGPRSASAMGHTANGGTSTLLAATRSGGPPGRSRTFDYTRPGYRTQFSSDVSPARRGMMGGGSTVCCGEENRFDPELDKSMMQTLNEVKYEARRPKFTAVVEANFQRECLEAHNLVRGIYGCPSLVWSQELAELAKAWALKLADRGRVLYPELSGIGENIHLVQMGATDEEMADAASHHSFHDPVSAPSHLTTGAELVANWAAEVEHFDFERPRWTPKCKRFTQMLWRSSIELGVARYWNQQSNCLAIVALYRPEGNANAPGDFAVNLPSKSEIREEEARSATQLQGLILQMNRATLNDGGFLLMNSNSNSTTTQY